MKPSDVKSTQTLRLISSMPTPQHVGAPSKLATVHDLATERDLKTYRKCDAIADKLVSLFIDLTHEIDPRPMDERELDFVGKVYEAALSAAIVRLA